MFAIRIVYTVLQVNFLGLKMFSTIFLSSSLRPYFILLDNFLGINRIAINISSPNKICQICNIERMTT